MLQQERLHPSTAMHNICLPFLIMESDLLTNISLYIFVHHGEKKIKIKIIILIVFRYQCQIQRNILVPAPYPIYKIISCDTIFVLFPEFGENTT
jgi:hypothetical protein